MVPDLIETNLRQPDAAYEAVRDVLGNIGGRSRDVIAILPDAAVRVVLLDFETLPSKRDEVEGVVRFRLKKSLPFDVDKAKISYHVQPSSTGVRVIAAVALANVVEDYEAAFRQAGYEPGVVMPSMLAALGAADAPKPSLIIKVDARTTSIAILDREQLLLFRTLENTRGVTITGEQLAEEVYPSVVFFQDTYQMNISQIYVAGLPESGSAAPALRAQTGAQVDGSGEPVAAGPECRFDPQMENGRRSRRFAFLICGLTSISPAVPMKIPGPCGCAGAELWRG